MYKDETLEHCIQKIKESNNSKTKLANYKKATKRLDELQSEYNKLSEVLKKPSGKKSDKTKKSDKKKTASSNSISIEKITSELDKILEEIDGEKSDMFELINSYVQYKLLLGDLNTEADKISNEINQVVMHKNKITITKLDPDDVF